jgi:hypothetical protein
MGLDPFGPPPKNLTDEDCLGDQPHNYRVCNYDFIDITPFKFSPERHLDLSARRLMIGEKVQVIIQKN